MAKHIPKHVVEWIESKPGPFTGRTMNSVWRAAFEDFCDGANGGDDSLSFMMHLGEVGIDVRPTKLGVYVLDTVQ